MSGTPSQIGPYAVASELGRGGMGVVYLATDSRLGRQVAIKALPEHFATDPERLARFEREARTLASLNHPNVAGIHGVEEHDGRKYLVLEYVEGITLADRLDRGALPVDEALEICAQVAAGLEAAHEAGVIHRDLKPANIRITPEGQAKVLDFGLARTEEATSSGSSVSQMPTLTTPHSPTQAGAILGTAPYMSPEQARGRRVDKRSDIWSFGVLLYECLTGMSPFIGETATDSIGAILHKDVDLNRLPTGTPVGVRRVLTRCLQRDKALRYRDIGDVRLELESADLVSEGSAAQTRGGFVGALAAGGMIAGLALGSVAVWLGMSLTADDSIVEAVAPPRRYTIRIPDSAPIAPPSVHPFGIARPLFDVSPDGSRLIYTALVEGEMHLYERDMATGQIRPVNHTRGGFDAVFSPDGREIAYFADDRIHTLELDRGLTPQSHHGASSPVGAVWGNDGRIYFTPAESSPVLAFPEGGGPAEPVTILSASGYAHGQPDLSSDGRFLIFTENADIARVYATRVGAPEEKWLLQELATGGTLTTSDHLLFMRDDRLMAAKIDMENMRVVGEAATVASNVRMSWAWGQFRVTDDGSLIFAEGSPDAVAEFVWVDRDGALTPLGLGAAEYIAFELSPDGRRLATPIRDGRDTDMWVYDLDRPQTPARLTFGGVHNEAAWSSDGRYLFFGKYNADGSSAILAKDMESGAPPAVLYEFESDSFPLQYDHASRELLFAAFQEGTGVDLMRGVVERDPDGDVSLENVEPARATRHSEPFAAISPDRKWIVANSDETGGWQLYLSSYPDFGSRVQISETGGEEPIWTDDGSRVLYRWNDTWYEVDVTTDPQLRVSQPRVIARGPYINVPGYSWDMTGDGERFLFLDGPQQDTPVTELQVITNFLGELERLVPGPDGP